MEYQEFLKQKQKLIVESGFDIDDSKLNKHLFDFQKFIVKRALKAGKYAIFADCGLGKTLMQLEWANRVATETNGWVLILAPLAVKAQTIKEGLKFGIYVQDYFDAVNCNDIENCNQGILIANYEQIDNIRCDIFTGIILDESSILKNFEGAIKKQIIDNFKRTPYKLACTATPSPNDPMEMGNHSEFLDVMIRNEMLAMYFVHDGGETAKWRLKGHAIKQFYKFISSWAIMLTNPADIGFPQTGYDLPELNIVENKIVTKHKGHFKLFNDTSVSATEFNAELRITKIERLSEAAKIINASNELFIVTVKQNEEADYIRSLVPDAIEVRGNDTDKYKQETLLGFAENKFRVLLSKGKIIKFGLNYQNCHNIVVCSLDFSFEELYQLIRRCLRYGQKEVVNLYLITTDTMSNVIASIELKQKQFEIMQKEMANQINEGLNDNEQSTLPVIRQDKNEWFDIKCGDSIQLIKEIESESVGLSVFSPPFPELYVYSSHMEDLGNCKDYQQFIEQLNFLTPELYRVMMQGRNVCIHCMDTPVQKGKHGFIGLKDFSGDILTAMQSAGFIYASRVTIWKDPVIEMQRTKALGLLHKQVKKDSTMSRVGIPDYIMIFRKDGDRTNPVTNIDLPVDLWQKYASPVWMDIDYGNTLQGFRNGREDSDEKHICPLQLDTIERLIHLYSNKGDTIFTPFMGIGSEVYQAVKMGRKAVGIELKESYYDIAKKNALIAVDAKRQMQLL